MRILSLMVRHGTQQYADAPQKLKALFAEFMPRIKHELVIADNALAPGVTGALDDGTMILGAPNDCQEFSAWQHAMEHFGEGLLDYDFVNLVTSAFNNGYIKYLYRFNESMLEQARGKRCAVGHISAYERSVTIRGFSSRHWLRTSFIMAQPAELLRLGSIISFPEPEAVFSHDPQAPFLPDCGLCATYQNYLLVWLTGVDLPAENRWEFCFRLTRESMPRFISKSLAIMNEHMLSIRLRAQGCALAEAIWLDSMTRAGTVPEVIPSWVEQLYQRDTDAVIVLDEHEQTPVNGVPKEPVDAAPLFSWLAAQNLEQGSALSSAWLSAETPTAQRGLRHWGLNLIGYPTATSGAAQSLKMLAKACYRNLIPYIVLEEPPGMARRENDGTFALNLSGRPVYTSNLFALSFPDVCRYAAVYGSALLTSHYNIGLPFWDLAFLPESIRPLLTLFHEIWALSGAQQRMFAEHTDKPVLHMPLAVELGQVDAIRRKDFGLPESAFIFAACYDGRESCARKNPEAAVKAFMRAFAKQDRDVLLLMKTMNLRGTPEETRLRSLAARDPRIITLDEVLDHSRFMGLLAACDAFVSLHRAEAFGLIIAENMLLGRPVIVTGAGGNADFCGADTAYLVDGPMVPVKEGEYAWSKGLNWCDPDVDMAAGAMRRVVEHPEEAAGKAAAACRLLSEMYSTSRIGGLYRQRIQEYTRTGAAILF